MKKLSSMGWWSVVKTVVKYGAYLTIIFQGITSIITAIEIKDGIKADETTN